jgi:hypothetical protein
MTELSREAELRGGGPAPAAKAAGSTMTREDQLRAARRLLGLPHPAEVDDVTKALRDIEFRSKNFLATKKRYSKPMKRAADSFAQGWVRAHKAGLPLPPSSWLLYYQEMAAAEGYLGKPGWKPKRAEGFKERFALEQALWLLSERNRPCVAGPKSEWCKLAAILLGMPKVSSGLVSQAQHVQAEVGL